jgi:hypothetical protein
MHESMESRKELRFMTTHHESKRVAQKKNDSEVANSTISMDDEPPDAWAMTRKNDLQRVGPTALLYDRGGRDIRDISDSNLRPAPHQQ